MKIKMIQLLELVANKENIPQFIKFDGDIYQYEDGYYCNKEVEDLFEEVKNGYGYYESLNFEIEIIDSPKLNNVIKKIPFDGDNIILSKDEIVPVSTVNKVIIDRLNRVIDKLGDIEV